MNTQKKIEKLIQAYIKIPDRVRSLAFSATTDLYFGGCDSEEYPGFSSAIKEISAWSDSLPGTLYVDLDCDHVSEHQPEGYQDEETGEYVEPHAPNCYCVEAKEIVRALFDRELASYL